MKSSVSQQSTGSADLSSELSAPPTGEATGRSSVRRDKDDSVQIGEKNSGQQAYDGSQNNPPNSEKSPGDHESPSGPTDVNTGTPTEERTTVPTIGDKARGEVDPDKDDSVQIGEKNSGQQAYDGSQNNPPNSEKSPGDHESPSGPTDVNTGTPTEERTTVPTIGDVTPVEVVKSEKVGHPPKAEKIIGYQADGKRQDYSKGDTPESDKPVDTTPDECSNQNLSGTSAVSQKEHPNEEIEKQKMSKKEDVELIGPTATQTELAEETGILGGGVKLLVAVALVALVAIVAQYYLQSKSPPQKTDWQQVDVFLKQMKKVKARFPNQRADLWTRSEIHLKRHLQTSQPAEPVSLILTSGVRAERTMRCLAQGVASAFSTARNASVLHIDGAGKAGQDSDQVKLDIDRKLQGAFEGDKPVAVIHRLEELPPGSTLIFYRYCDHENAAYKKTFLIFTVLLGDEEEIPAEMRLSIVEEMVDDYLQKRFLSHGHPVSFDRMDLNKYGGLWSRISHLILPVAAEDRIEQEGC